MIKVENVEVFNFEGAVRGMRNPMNSWDKSDSYMCDENHCGGKCMSLPDEKDCNQPDGYHIGKNDLALMRRLYRAGPEHRKYLRQIFVSMDITAPLYWWKEFDTYKIGTVANSCSTMHKIHAKPFTPDDFSCDHIGKDMVTEVYNECFENILDILNEARECYLIDGKKCWWWQIIQLLPSSYNQKRTITMNYENVISMIYQRKNHKLDEWNDFVEELKKLPYIKEIIE